MINKLRWKYEIGDYIVYVSRDDNSGAMIGKIIERQFEIRYNHPYQMYIIERLWQSRKRCGYAKHFTFGGDCVWNQSEKAKLTDEDIAGLIL